MVRTIEQVLYGRATAAILTPQQTIIETNFNFEPGAMNKSIVFLYINHSVPFLALSGNEKKSAEKC